MIDTLLRRLFYIGLDLEITDDYPFIMVTSINGRECAFMLGSTNYDGEFEVSDLLFINIRKTIE